MEGGIYMSIAISSSNSYDYNNYNASLRKKVTDDPAGAAIAEKHLSQIKGYDQGSRNGEDGQSLINVADGALSQISDSLQRMRELSLQASNSAIYSD